MFQLLFLTIIREPQSSAKVTYVCCIYGDNGVVTACGVLFYVLSDVLLCVLLWVGNRFVGRCEGLLTILFFVVLFGVVG